MQFLFLICFLSSLILIQGCARRPPLSKWQRVSKPAECVNFNPYSAFSMDRSPDPMPMPATSTLLYKPEISSIALPLKRKTAIQKEIIVIDPGHGGADFGTHSNGSPKYHEKHLNLSTAQMLKKYLQNSGYHVVMTRTDDTFISLEDRALFANQRNPKLFISVHYNSAPSIDAEGIEVYYYRAEDNKSRTEESKALAQAILDKTIGHTKAKSRGVKHGNYAVIRETNMPAILIEGGFLTNDAEMDKLKNAEYQKGIALGIAQGIQDYLAREMVRAKP